MGVRRGYRCLLAVLLCLCLFPAGCSKSGISLGGYQISGLTSGELLCVGDEVFPLSEAMIFVTSQKKLYQDTYGEEIWQVSLGEESLEDYALEQLRSHLGRLFAASQMAEEMRLSLTAQENVRLSQAVDDYMAHLGEQDQEVAGITREDAEYAFRRYLLADRAYQAVLASADVEVSEDEARVMEIQQLFFAREDLSEEEQAARKSQAEQAAQAAAETNDFSGLAEQYAGVEFSQFSVKRSDLSPEMEQTVFALSNGSVSGLLESEDGWRVIRCVNSYDREATAANREQMEQKRAQDAFQAEMSEFLEEHPAVFNDSLWKNVTLSGYPGEASANFYDSYQTYFEEE